MAVPSESSRGERRARMLKDLAQLLLAAAVLAALVAILILLCR